MSRKRRSRCWWWAMRVGAVRYRGVIYMWRVGWGGVPDRCRCFVAPSPNWREWDEFFYDEVLKMLQKGDSRKVSGQSASSLDGGEWAGSFPGLWSHMTQVRWEDGSARQPSSLLIFEQDGMLKAMLRDKSAGLCLWVAARSVPDIFCALEGGIMDADTEWRQDRTETGQSAKRTKRTG